MWYAVWGSVGCVQGMPHALVCVCVVGVVVVHVLWCGCKGRYCAEVVGCLTRYAVWAVPHCLPAVLGPKRVFSSVQGLPVAVDVHLIRRSFVHAKVILIA